MNAFKEAGELNCLAEARRRFKALQQSKGAQARRAVSESSIWCPHQFHLTDFCLHRSQSTGWGEGANSSLPASHRRSSLGSSLLSFPNWSFIDCLCCGLKGWLFKLAAVSFSLYLLKIIWLIRFCLVWRTLNGKLQKFSSLGLQLSHKSNFGKGEQPQQTQQNSAFSSI